MTRLNQFFQEIHRRSLWQVLGIFPVVFLLGLSGCAEEAGGPVKVSVETDSDGVTHVHFGGDWDRSDGSLRLKERYRIGSERPLFRVTDAHVMPDGALVLGNSGSHELLWFDTSGAFVRATGGKGQGPGEFEGLTAILGADAGGVQAYDTRIGRLTHFDSSGGLVGAKTLMSGGGALDVWPLGMPTDGSVYATYGARRVYSPTGGAVRDAIPLLRVQLSGEHVDTLGSWGGTEWYYQPQDGRITRLAVGFGRGLVFAGRDRRAVIGSTDSLDLHVFDENGLVMRITAPGRSLAVPADSIDAWRDDLKERLESAPPALRNAYTVIPIYETYPDLTGVAMGPDGRVAFGLTAPGAEDVWLFLSADGSLDGSTTMPSGWQVLDMSHDRLAVLHRDSLDQEFVSVLDIVR